MRIDFAESRQSTLGLEWEIALVDRESGDLRSVAQEILDGVHANHGNLGPDEEHPHVKQELLLNTVEIVTGVCETVAQAKKELHDNMQAVREIADPMGVELFSAGSHPIAQPSTQPVTDKERYGKLIDRTQWWGRQMVIYGVHVHVGVDHKSKVLPIVDGLINFQPHLQALSASSPFWGGEDTGYASQRALMFQQLPTAGLPYHFSQWSEYESYVADMLHTGVIDDISEIRWDVRPVPRFGTVEMRIADGLSSLKDVGAMAALTQCMVQSMSDRLDAGERIPVMPQWYRVENKWRAARYGLDAIIILDKAGNEQLVTEHLTELLNELEPVSKRLGCENELRDVERIMRGGAGYQWQRKIAAENNGDLCAVVRDNTARMRLT
ncbi:glutamate--cysteine ligase [Neomicrococcus lactis]|uniref:glutamate--cysteine ligase n=1 Tax=Neomicrococcus lactis TaxID=732241 RepID=UPI0023002551|nr:glutamate--cysteine ligase [Neomicrococcus lactis]